jgi:Zn-dependent M28 family amino/carboxypeptidase
MRNLLLTVCLLGGLLASVGCSSAACSAPEGSLFDQNSAWRFLLTQVSFGPRTPGSPAHQACRDYLLARLQEYCDTASAQDFTAVVGQETLSLSNIIGVRNPNGSPHILLCAHWDSRPRADEDLDPANWNKPIAGANDGASGVAVLLELARVLAAAPPWYKVSIVFFDGEDYGVEIKDYLLGSKYYAAQLAQDRPARGILLDMIGDKDLRIPQEGNSVAAAPDLVNAVWGVAASLGERTFVPEAGYTILDDHLPLIQAGVPTIDLIDFDYPYWHTVQDTADRCSPASLGAVGRVLLAALTEGLL